MCHLTATRQTQFTNCDLTDFVKQFELILKHYETEPAAECVHIAWMARGEPLSNPTLTETSTELLLRLGQMCRDRSLLPKFNISTIMPVTMRKRLVEMFPIITPTIYYSLYSVDPQFRAKWLPAAMNALEALDQLYEYQYVSKKIIKFHGAFIQGENDSIEHVRHMCDAIRSRTIRGEFNIVRYNPFSSEQGSESTNLDAIATVISEYMPCKIISRVGTDVAATCGTFIQS